MAKYPQIADAIIHIEPPPDRVTAAEQRVDNPKDVLTTEFTDCNASTGVTSEPSFTPLRR